MKCYIAFSISGTNCFIIATKEMDDVAEVIADYKLGIARAMMDRLHKIHGV